MIELEKEFQDQIIELKEIEPKELDLPYPHVYMEKKLIKAELDFIFKTTNKKELTEENSLPLYWIQGEDYDLLGRLLFYGVDMAVTFKILDLPVYYKDSPDAEPVNLIESNNITKFVRVSKDLVGEGDGDG